MSAEQSLYDELIASLVALLSSRHDRPQIIETFVARVSDARGGGEKWDVLRELAWDLSFYVQNGRERAEDPSYYGDERIEREVGDALMRLESLTKPNQ